MTRLNRRDITNILSWAGLVKARSDEINVPFDGDEDLTLLKLKKIHDIDSDIGEVTEIRQERQAFADWLDKHGKETYGSDWDNSDDAMNADPHVIRKFKAKMKELRSEGKE